MSLGEPSECEGTENRMTHHRQGGLGRRIARRAKVKAADAGDNEVASGVLAKTLGL